MTVTWKFHIDGYAAETSDPYLAELIQHLLDQIDTANKLLRAFVGLTEHISVVANDSPESKETQE